jgi:hypothetical protein
MGEEKSCDGTKNASRTFSQNRSGHPPPSLAAECACFQQKKSVVHTIAEKPTMLSRLLSRRSAVRAMSGVAVKVYVPTPEEQRLPAAALKTQFFNLGIEHVSLAQLQGKHSKAKNVRLAALSEAGELLKEKLDYYKPTVHPTQNQSTMTVKQVKTLLATPGATEISEADKAKTLAAIATMSDSQTVVVENTKFGQPLIEHFVEELGLHISRAAIASGNADPLLFMKSLYTKGMLGGGHVLCWCGLERVCVGVCCCVWVAEVSVSLTRDDRVLLCRLSLQPW